MLERWLEGARRIVVLGHAEARERGAEEVGTEHILLGLLREEDGLVGRALDALGISYRRVCEQVALTNVPRHTVIAEPVPFSDATNRVFECAGGEARSLGHEFVGTEHILLAVVNEAESAAVRILAGCGTTAAQVRDQILGAVSAFGARHVRKPGSAGRIQVRSESDILAWAVEHARRYGDFNPTLVQHASSTRRAAATALGWGTDEETLVYVVVMQGQFGIERQIRHDRHHRLPEHSTASVIPVLFRVIELGSGRVIDSGGRRALPDLSSIGPVITDLDDRARATVDDSGL